MASAGRFRTTTLSEALETCQSGLHRLAYPREASMAGRKTFDIGRDSSSGQFIPVKEAESRPSTTTVERVPKPGYGDTKN